jgi:hypothetical protein
MLNMKYIVIFIMLGLSSCATVSESTADQKASAAKPRQYTFTWDYTEDSPLKPRGGTSIGVPVTLDKQPSPEWLKLQEADISDVERDRRAILAMVGEYKVTFDFVEVVGFTPNYKQVAPYRSWATEKVYVLEDRSDFISLQHILVMQTISEDGTKSAPMLTKHWRQDWQYQPKQVLLFKGHSTWQTEAVPEAQQKGAWSQTVYQVDDSPRYGGVAAWQHFGNYSNWNSPNTWRPLPRREYSVRNDYQLLLGNNDVIILPTGWAHEQQNNKVVLSGQANAKNVVIAREIGFNRYERIKGYDFSLSDAYLKNTGIFWQEVRKQWAQLAKLGKPLQVRQGSLHGSLFEYADNLHNGKQVKASEMIDDVKEAVNAYLVKEKANASTLVY